MQDFRCSCKKIVCQLEGNSIIIKCRHCKRYIQINTKGITGFQFKLGPEESPQSFYGETGPNRP